MTQPENMRRHINYTTNHVRSLIRDAGLEALADFSIPRSRAFYAGIEM